MSFRVGRVVAITAASLIWLAACETTSSLNPFKLSNSNGSETPDARAEVETTRSVQPPVRGPTPPTPELLGADPNDDLNIAKKYFRQGSYGLAEQRFRK